MSDGPDEISYIVADGSDDNAPKIVWVDGKPYIERLYKQWVKGPFDYKPRYVWVVKLEELEVVGEVYHGIA